MKKIEAYLRPDILEPLRSGLKELDIKGLSIEQVMGCGKQLGWTEFVRGSEIEYNFLTKIRIELVVHDHQVEPIIAKIIEITRTGEVGDGKIFISDIADAIRIRTGERGEAALN
jgi:nitrogen regulatory protein P-II 1